MQPVEHRAGGKKKIRYHSPAAAVVKCLLYTILVYFKKKGGGGGGCTGDLFDERGRERVEDKKGFVGGKHTRLRSAQQHSTSVQELGTDRHGERGDYMRWVLSRGEIDRIRFFFSFFPFCISQLLSLSRFIYSVEPFKCPSIHTPCTSSFMPSALNRRPLS